MIRFLRLLPARLMSSRSSTPSCFNRFFADAPKTDAHSKQIAVRGTENEQRMRVRRARPSDVPRVLRFVREHARSAWPSFLCPAPPGASNLVLCDYVARALAQGHTMLAEQHESRRGWLRIRGLALATAVCPWDAAMLEQWARCVSSARSRHLVHFTAHCLRAPGLHDKYRVHNILQVIMIVPPDTPQNSEIIHVLAKNAIQRGRDVGFPLIRFDVTSEDIAKCMDNLNLKKEWHLSYDILPEIMSEGGNYQSPEAKAKKGSFIAVYTAFTKDKNPSPLLKPTRT